VREVYDFLGKNLKPNLESLNMTLVCMLVWGLYSYYIASDTAHPQITLMLQKVSQLVHLLADNSM
jgi:hypothetical protein